MISQNKKRIVITLDKRTLMLLEEMQHKNSPVRVSKSFVIQEAIWTKWRINHER